MRSLGRLLKYVYQRYSYQLIVVFVCIIVSAVSNVIVNAFMARLIDEIIVYPGETFSFWRSVGKPTARKGFRDGLVISKNGLYADIGGGLCQMANMIHWLVLHTPLTVTEMHHHSDALFPDVKRRVPFGTGTSVAYKAIDYRFKNTTGYPVQIRVWFIELINELEERYDIEIQPTQVPGGSFSSVDNIVRLVESLKS